jgi:general secretion pathway protein D
MSRWTAWVAAGLCGALLAACSVPNASGSLESPDLLDQLANSNLSAPRPSGAKGPRVEFASNQTDGPATEFYPGSDVVARKPKTPAAQGVSRSSNGYELNFNDAELSELAKVILRDTLSLPYVFNPRVQGRVTVSTGGPVSREGLISILESVLAMYRGGLVIDGGVYRIVPDVEARQNAVLSVNYTSEQKEVGPGYGITIIPLRYVSAETMTGMLASLGSTQDPPRASVYNNLLIVRGTASHRRSLIEIASIFDVDWMEGQSAGLYTLRNSAPEDVIKELKNVFQVGGPGKGLVRFQAIERLNAILALSNDSQHLENVETWVERLDRGGPEGDNFYVYRVENGRAKDLTEILMAAFTGQSGTVRQAEESEVAPTEAATRDSTTTSPAAGDSGGPISATAAGAAASEPSAEPLAVSSVGLETGAVAQGGSERVRIIPDERNNKLLIKASGRDLRKILNILRRIDQPPLQVLINATLAEVTLNDNLQYGVQFFLEKNNGKAGLLGFSNGSALEIAPAVPGLNFIVGSVAGNPRVVIDALAEQTSVRVVSSPSVVVLHNQEATLQVGDEVPIITRQAQSVINPDSPVVNEIEYKNTGVILKVTPRINTNGVVTMDIEQEISSVARATNANLTPTISQRRISSTIAVESTQMVVLGGLISEQHDRAKSSIPVLGKIPYLGDVLGGSNDTSKTRTELVVFLQPVVIRDPQDAARVAEEMRARMRSLAPRPTPWDVDVDLHASGSMVQVK